MDFIFFQDVAIERGRIFFDEKYFSIQSFISFKSIKFMHSYFDPRDILFLGAYTIGIGDSFISYLKSHRADFTTIYGYNVWM